VAFDQAPDELRAAFTAEQRVSARTTALLAGVIAIVAFPLWAMFDAIVVPDQADAFLGVRIGFELALVVGWLLLRSPAVGGRWPEQLAFGLVCVVELGIGWMIPRTGDRIEPYLLGLSLAIFASCFLIVWRWQLTALLAAFTAASTSLFCLTADPVPEAHHVASIVFYLSTAAALAIVAAVYRHRTAWQRFVAQAGLEAERARNEALVRELDQLSREDPLTGVGNRRAWEERVAGELLRANRQGGTLSVIVCDLDHFKTVNDTLGHAAGDRVLRAASTLLTERVRGSDFVARLGGDEFCVLCPDTGLVDAEVLAVELADLARAMDWPNEAHVTLSVGVAEARPGDTDPGDVLHRADRALYEAKTTRDAVRIA
jgi:diguanylate cyclase (GGDEF)-like protein